MKPGPVTEERQGFTRLELLTVVITVVVLAGLLLPAMTKSGKTRPHRINCLSNLKQIGLASRMWANDHQERFPWNVSTNEGGTLEYAEQGGVLFHFRALSNELNTPKVLVCFADTSRTRATAFDPLPSGAQPLTNARTQISYFVGLDAQSTQPQSILIGDRNLEGGTLASNGILTVTRGDRLSFTRELHQGEGNIGLGDGSAQQFSSIFLNRQLEAALRLQTNEPVQMRLVLPQ